jgi:hypothetical protein
MEYIGKYCSLHFYNFQITFQILRGFQKGTFELTVKLGN